VENRVQQGTSRNHQAEITQQLGNDQAGAARPAQNSAMGTSTAEQENDRQ
jgi:hypothetical protein